MSSPASSPPESCVCDQCIKISSIDAASRRLLPSQIFVWLFHDCSFCSSVPLAPSPVVSIVGLAGLRNLNPSSLGNPSLITVLQPLRECPLRRHLLTARSFHLIFPSQRLIHNCGQVIARHSKSFIIDNEATPDVSSIYGVKPQPLECRNLAPTLPHFTSHDGSHLQSSPERQLTVQG